MKRRIRSLFGLGLLLTLTMTVPAYAADDRDKNKNVSEEMSESGIEIEENGQDAVEQKAPVSFNVGKKQELENVLQINRSLMDSGWKLYNGNPVYFDSEGQMVNSGMNGWLNHLGSSFWMKNGIRQIGWQKIEGNWYYLDPKSNGPATGWFTVDGETYYADQNGVMKTGWMKLDGNWYYFDASGAMQTGFYTVGSQCYYSEENGVMKTGWLEKNGITYFFKDSGAMARNEWIDGWYFKSDGAYVNREGSEKEIVVAIDAGHQQQQNKEKEPMGPGSSTLKQKVSSGTCGVVTRLNEYVLNLDVSLQLAQELIQRGYAVYMIRTTHDVNISNVQRAQMAAENGAAILIRVHANGDSDQSMNGALMIAPTNQNPYLSAQLISESQKLSQVMLDEFCAATGARKLFVYKVDNMTGINWATMPVTIVEMGYMSNPTEDRLMASASYQAKMVQGMANGVDRYFGQ